MPRTTRSYMQHELCTIQRHQKRRRNGPIDRRTRNGKNAESMRSGIIQDKGGAEACSTMMLAAIELFVQEVAGLSEINEGIRAYLKKHPEHRKNAKGLAQLNSYRQANVNTILKLAPLIGLGRVEKVKDIYDLLAEDEENSRNQDMATEPEASEGNPPDRGEIMVSASVSDEKPAFEKT